MNLVFKECYSLMNYSSKKATQQCKSEKFYRFVFLRCLKTYSKIRQDFFNRSNIIQFLKRAS